jgi:hypothetical protein
MTGLHSRIVTVSKIQSTKLLQLPNQDFAELPPVGGMSYVEKSSKKGRTAT